MKKICILLALAVMVFGCKSKKKEVVWEEVYLIKDMAGITVDLNYPHMSYLSGREDAVSDKINKAIENYLVESMPVGCKDCPVDSAVNRLIGEKMSDTVLMKIPYELRSDGSVYDWKHVVSVRLETSYYTGGANANHRVQYLNFDNRTGELLAHNEFIGNREALRKIAKEEFMSAKGLTGDETPEQTHLFIELENFDLPESIGFEEEGLVLFYNLYEIAPHSYGTTEIIVPYHRIASILKMSDLH